MPILQFLRELQAGLVGILLGAIGATAAIIYLIITFDWLPPFITPPGGIITEDSTVRVEVIRSDNRDPIQGARVDFIITEVDGPDEWNVGKGGTGITDTAGIAKIVIGLGSNVVGRVWSRHKIDAIFFEGEKTGIILEKGGSVDVQLVSEPLNETFGHIGVRHFNTGAYLANVMVQCWQGERFIEEKLTGEDGKVRFGLDGLSGEFLFKVEPTCINNTLLGGKVSWTASQPGAGTYREIMVSPVDYTRDPTDPDSFVPLTALIHLRDSTGNPVPSMVTLDYWLPDGTPQQIGGITDSGDLKLQFTASIFGSYDVRATSKNGLLKGSGKALYGNICNPFYELEITMMSPTPPPGDGGGDGEPPERQMLKFIRGG